MDFDIPSTPNIGNAIPLLKPSLTQQPQRAMQAWFMQFKWRNISFCVVSRSPQVGIYGT
jgi:hypothetical protein